MSWSVLLRVAVGRGTIADPPVFPRVADRVAARYSPGEQRARFTPMTLVAHARRNVRSDRFAAASALQKSKLVWPIMGASPADSGIGSLTGLRRDRAAALA